MTAQEAQHLIAQLPSKLEPGLEQCLDGPDRSVTADAMRDELARTFGLEPEGASALLRAVFKAVSGTVAPGQINDVRGQLPEGMKHLFLHSGS